MKRLPFLILSLFALTVHADEKRPNIVFFLADDLGWTGLSCFGSDLYETPNLDKLAAEGLKFTDAYSACTVCSPSRAAIMTGKYPARLHLTDFIAGQDRPFAKLSIPEWQKWLKHEEVTIAEALRDGGYKTAHIGKWHLDQKSKNAANFEPVDHGFDRQVLKPKMKGNFLAEKAGDFQPGDFMTDYFASEASKIINEWKNEPFFINFDFHVPHTPVQGKDSLVDEFSKKAREDATHKNPHYAAMVKSMDEAVGTVLKTLERNHLIEDTLIIFTSDNGGLTQRYGKHDEFTENLPLRRGKGSAYEGGVRVPMIVKWPGKTPAGETCDEPVIGIDFYSTFLEVAGVKGNPSHNQNVDGQSLVPLFENPDSSLNREAIYFHYPHYHAGGDSPYSAVRKGDWRFIQFHEDQSELLFDIKKDPAEKTNQAEAETAVATELREKLKTWRESVGAQMPTMNDKFDPAKQTMVIRPKKARR